MAWDWTSGAVENNMAPQPVLRPRTYNPQPLLPFNPALMGFGLVGNAANQMSNLGAMYQSQALPAMQLNTAYRSTVDPELIRSQRLESLGRILGSMFGGGAGGMGGITGFQGQGGQYAGMGQPQQQQPDPMQAFRPQKPGWSGAVPAFDVRRYTPGKLMV